MIADTFRSNTAGSNFAAGASQLVCCRFSGINYFSFFLSTVAPFAAMRRDATLAR